LGAFNDNVFKNALIILITSEVAASDLARTNISINLCDSLFVPPFFLFLAATGQLFDKY
jgi:hypothetical protein